MTQDRLLTKLQKLIATRDSEKELGNSEAAESFAALINKLLLQHELSLSEDEIKNAVAGKKDEEPIIEYRADLSKFGVKRKKARSQWQERLAGIVAEAHLCRIAVATGTNTVWFVGTRTNAEVAEYAFGTLIPVAAKLARSADFKYRAECKKKWGSTEAAFGFRAAWLAGFVNRIGERLAETRDAVIRESHGTTAMIRLDGALARTDAFVQEKYKKKVGGLKGQDLQGNIDGLQRGRKAADDIALGTKGIEAPSSPKGYL